MAYRSSSKIATETSATSAAVPVPTGAAIGDIAVVSLYMENTSATAVTSPAGFTVKADVNTNGATQGRLLVYWKRLTAADTGTYTFSWTGAVWRAGNCELYSGRIATGDPFTATSTADAGLAGRTVTCPAITAAAGDDLVSAMLSYAGLGSTPTMTSPLTVRQGVTTNDLAMGSADNVSVGTTGAKTYAYTGGSAGGMKGFLGALKVAASTTPVSATRTVSWDAKAAVGPTRTVSYAVKAEVIATRTIAFDVDAFLTISRTIAFDVKAALSATRTASWAVKASLLTTRTASWNVSSQVSVTRSLSWNTLLSVVATRAMSWTVKQAVTAARTVTWDVAGTLASVAITRTLSWAVEAQIAITRSLSWNTKTGVGPTRTASWAVKQLVARTRTLSWTTKSRTIATRTVSFNVKQAVGQSRVISYDVIVTVGGGVATVYVKGEGGTLQPATLVGVWDGTAVVPASIRSIT